MRKAAGILATLTSQGYQPQRARVRLRERERELEALQNETAEESPCFLCQRIYVALWLRVATEPDTCWSPHDWTHLWTNWALQGHLDKDDIQHTRMHIQASTIPIDKRIVHNMNTPAQTYSVTLWLLRVMDQSRLKLSWILHAVWWRRRIIIEKWRSYFRLLEIQLFLFAFCHADVDSGWWSVVQGHLGISLFCLRGSNGD